MRNLLPVSFYERETPEVARDLLGKILVVKKGLRELSVRIVETEAYRENDPASHSCRGPTPRSRVMFGDPGVAYVYFIYGMYEMLNFVTEPAGKAGAVLIRAAEALECEESPGAGLLNGPGKLCRALGIKRSHNEASLRGPKLQVFDDGYRPRQISVSSRVGIRVGTETPWRFFEAGHRCVSRAPQNKLARHLEAVVR